MVYSEHCNLTTMAYGTTSCNKSAQSWRQNCVPVQKKPYSGFSGSRWSHYEDYNKGLEWGGDTLTIYPLVPLTNGMVRGVSKRGLTRREYAICLLEARYPCQHPTDIAEFEKPIKRKRENGFGESPRSVRGNQQTAHGKCQAAVGTGTAKTRLKNHRCSSNDTCCNKVLQNLGSHLIAPWLTPLEMLHVRLSSNYKWCWSMTWHGGSVQNRSLAAFTAAHLQNRECIHYLFEKYSAKQLLRALFFILPAAQYLKYVNRYGNIFCLKKLI